MVCICACTHKCPVCDVCMSVCGMPVCVRCVYFCVCMSMCVSMYDVCRCACILCVCKSVCVLYVCSVFVCVYCVCTCLCVCEWRSEEHLWDPVLFPPKDLGINLRLSGQYGNCFYLLHHPAGPTPGNYWRERGDTYTNVLLASPWPQNKAWISWKSQLLRCIWLMLYN